MQIILSSLLACSTMIFANIVTYANEDTYLNCFPEVIFENLEYIGIASEAVESCELLLFYQDDMVPLELASVFCVRAKTHFEQVTNDMTWIVENFANSPCEGEQRAEEYFRSKFIRLSNHWYQVRELWTEAQGVVK